MKEIVPVKMIEKSESNKFIWTSIYKCCHMIIRLLLDVRSNQHFIAEKMGFKLGERNETIGKA